MGNFFYIRIQEESYGGGEGKYQYAGRGYELGA